MGAQPLGRRSGAPPLSRRERVRLAFGVEDAPGTRSASSTATSSSTRPGLVPEATRDGRPAPVGALPPAVAGAPMRFDHRRILATAISRLRAKLKYRPVVFELMAPEFSLTELQLTVEAISGRHVHKQNFRRLVEAAASWSRPGPRAGRSGAGRRPSSVSAAMCSRSAPRPASGSGRARVQVDASLPPLARSMSSIRRRVMTPTRKKPNSGFW